MRQHFILTSGKRLDSLGMTIHGSPADWMYELLDAGVWGGNADTPNFMSLVKGDRVIVQSVETGFVATAVVQSSPRKTRKSVLRNRNCTHEIALKVKDFNVPVQRSLSLRLAISRADKNTPRRRTWQNYFRLGIRPISAAVFNIISKG